MKRSVAFFFSRVVELSSEMMNAISYSLADSRGGANVFHQIPLVIITSALIAGYFDLATDGIALFWCVTFCRARLVASPLIFAYR